MSVYYPLGRAEDVSEGEYEEMYALCNEVGEPPHARSSIEPAGSWRTRGGAVLRVAEMSATHLTNAVRLFERNGLGDHPKVQELRAELARRGS